MSFYQKNPKINEIAVQLQNYFNQEKVEALVKENGLLLRNYDLSDFNSFLAFNRIDLYLVFINSDLKSLPLNTRIGFPRSS